MNYETAKKLKDAGYPQKPHMPHGVLCAEFGCAECMAMDDVYKPTLEELIEALGEDFVYLEKDSLDKEWEAGGVLGIMTGDTPAEALAHLWLAIHEKK